MPLAINSLRVGHKYYVRNYDEVKKFELVQITPEEKYIAKDIETLEIFDMDEITRYGIGKDYELIEYEDEI
ncbi:hypothetical protein ACFLU5_14240 [Bacteroidota bacterium]